MAVHRWFRFSMATIMMLVVTSAAASALFVKYRALVGRKNDDPWMIDAPALLLLGIGLTALLIAALRNHTAVQTMIQATLACLMFLVLFHLEDMDKVRWAERAVRYWFQACFALTVVLPLLARRILSADMEPGPRRDWWRSTLESVVGSFANLILVSIGAFFEYIYLSLPIVPL